MDPDFGNIHEIKYLRTVNIFLSIIVFQHLTELNCFHDYIIEVFGRYSILMKVEENTTIFLFFLFVQTVFVKPFFTIRCEKRIPTRSG